MQLNSTMYLFFGPPGVGKGTLAQKCVNEFGWTHISTGSICRKHIAQKTELGLKIMALINQGNLIDDYLMLDLLENEIKAIGYNSSSIILDGFPRNALQAVLFDQFIKKKFDKGRPTIVYFNASLSIIEARLKGRIICSNILCEKVYNATNAPLKCEACGSELINRVDDSDDTVIARRLSFYMESKDSVIKYWKEKGYSIICLDNEKHSDSVFNDFRNSL
jgi:adenylate kinase